MFPMTITKNYINLVIGGRSRTVEASNKLFPQLLDAVKAKDWDQVDTLSDLALAVNKVGAGKVVVEDGIVFYNGMPSHNVVASRILDMVAEGHTVEPMIAFLENLMQNPSQSAIDELYIFMEANSLPITTDGHFLAYKVVTNDFKDKHTRTFDNSVGAVLDMDRNLCDPNRAVTCSTGFHFCGFKYLSFFGSHGDQIMIVKVNPKDVTSIPNDHDNAKGRACHYVIHEHYGAFEDFFQIDNLSNSSVVDLDDDYDDDSFDDDIDDDCPWEPSEEMMIPVSGNPIKQIRQLAGFSQRELADFAGFSKSTLWNAEQPDNHPKFETMERWANDISLLAKERGDDRMFYFTQKDGKFFIKVKTTTDDSGSM